MTDIDEAHAAAVREGAAMASPLVGHIVRPAIRAYLAAMERAGWVMVPVEATEAQLEAVWHVTTGWLDIQGSQATVNREKQRRRYAAAIAARPVLKP